MGAYGPMIAQDMAQAGQEALARTHAIADEQRKAKLGMAIQAYNDAPDAAGRGIAQNAIQSLYPTPAHAPTFLSDLLHLHARKQAAQQAQQVQGGQPGAASLAPSGGAAGPIAVDDEGATGTAGNVPTPQAQPAAVQSQAQPKTQAPPISQIAQAPTAADAWRRISQIPSTTELGINAARASAQNAQLLADKNNAARIQETVLRTYGNAAMQKLDAFAQSMGADSFATATTDQKLQAMKNLHAANVTPTWKSVTDGNSIFAVDAHDPTKRQLIGHKDDLASHVEYKTMQAGDGSQYLVPITVWSKKGSSVPVMETQGEDEGATPAAPVSTKTPAGPSTTASTSSSTSAGSPNPGARTPGTKPAGGAVKPHSASTTNANSTLPTGIPKGAIPFGSKGSPLLKSDTQQYTKIAEDVNGANEAFNALAPLYTPGSGHTPTSSSDQELVYAWVRSNVAGAGRMTQAEIKQGTQVGSFGQKAKSLLSQAQTGKMAPEIEQMLFSDVKRGLAAKNESASKLREQVRQDMTPGGKPQSTSTPTPPGGGWKAPTAAPPAPKENGKVLRENPPNGPIIARSQNGQWVQP